MAEHPQPDQSTRKAKLFRLLVENVVDYVIFVIDPEGRVCSWSKGTERLFGYTEAEILGESGQRLFTPEDVRDGAPEQEMRQALATGMGEGDRWLVRKDGSRFWADGMMTPLWDEGSVLRGFARIMRDRTEWKRRDEAPAERERLASLGPEVGLVLAQGGTVREMPGREGPFLDRRVEILALRADGSEFPVELAITRIPSDGPPVFAPPIRDIAAREAAGRRRSARLAITEALAGAATPGAAAAGVLRAGCEGLGWDVGAIWAVDEGGVVLRCLDFWSRPSATVGRFEAASRHQTYGPGVGLPGRVWGTGRPAWIPDVTVEPNFPRAPIAAEVGLHGAFAAPITIGEEFLGVVEFYSGEVQEPDPDLLEMMATLGGQVGQFLERRRAEERLRRSERELADFFENATVGLHWVGPDGTILRANRTELDLLGYDRDEYVGRHIAEFHADEDVIRDILRRLQAGEALHDYPARLRCKDGRIKDVRIDSSVMREDEEFVHTRCFTRDVTERNRAEEHLREQTRIAESLNRIGVLLAAEHDLQRLVQVVTDEATRLTDARFGAFFYNVPDGKGGAYTLYTISGVPREAFSRFPMPRATDLFGTTFRGEGVVRLDDVTRDPRYGRNAPHHGMPEGHLPVRSYLAVPVASRTGEVLGGLFFGHPEVAVFTEADERLVVGIAAQAAVAIDNARLYGDLQESERRFRQLADAVPQVVWASEADGTTTYFNRRWYDYTGLTPEQSLAPGGWRAAVHPDDLPALDEATRSPGAARAFEAEYRLRDRTGVYRWHLGRAVPVTGDDGRALRQYGTATDIDDRRREERTARFLAEASAALAELVDYEETLGRVAGMAVPAFADWCAVDMRDEAGGLRRVAVTHPDPEKLRLAHDLFEAYPPGPDDAHGIGKVLRTGEPELIEEIGGDWLESFAHDAEHLRRVRSLGLKSYLCVPLRSGGETTGVLTFATAESGRRYRAADLRVAEDLARRARVAIENSQLYRALREADRSKGELLATLRDGEERFRTMAESIPQLAWMARPDGHIYWFNKRWHDYTGTTPEQMEGWGWQEVHDPDMLPVVLERWKGSIASGEPFDMVFPLRGGDGRFRPFLTRIAPVRGEDGRIAHWFGTNTDISDRLRIEEELRSAKEDAEAANRAKSQFLAVLSHELRTPLNPILLTVSSMLERLTPPEDIRPNLEMIQQNVNLQSRLIDDLLDVMRIVRGKMPLHWEAADCHGLIRQALQICQSEVFGKELRLDLDLGAQEHFLNADPARFQQVIWNLVKNAVKFTPGGGVVSIRTRDQHAEGAGHLVVEVADTGIGIEPEILPLVFDPFQQGETRITRKFGGLGLGLAICRGIVEAHGGTLTAESPGKDRGTTFRIVLKTIPRPAATDGEPAGNMLDAGPNTPSSLRILVVEDEPATLRLMARLLRGLGHAVTSANTIASGYAAFEAGEFNLIVSDIGLPDGTGLELMRRAVALRGTIPAIALTGYGMEEDIVRSREAGFTAHMTKPIDFTKLEAMIRQVATVGGDGRPASTRDEERGR